MEQLPNSAMIMIPSVQPRYPTGPQDWEIHKSEIEDLYRHNTLEHIMHSMQERHAFRATKKQWKSQLKKWGFKKRTERDEYRAILKLKRRREEEQPDRASEFGLRGKVVPSAKITRYVADALKDGRITEEDTFSQVATPPDLQVWTPKFEEAVPSSPDGVGHPRPNSSSTIQFQHHGSGSLGRESLTLPFHRLPSVRYSASFPQNSAEYSQQSMQLVPASPPRSPPLQPFDWWWDFADFSIPQSPAILRCPSSNPLVRLLAPLSQKIDNYEDARFFIALVISARKEFGGVGCRVYNILASLALKYVSGGVEDPKKFERFVGAAIQKLSEWTEVDYRHFVEASFLVGTALSHLGRNGKALPLLIEGLKMVEIYISHNDLAQYRVNVALCHSELSQYEEAVEQLRLAFGPEFGRLAILAPTYYCSEHDNLYIIASDLIMYGERFNGVLSLISEHDRIADVEIPAGTFCLEHEIIPETDVEQSSTLYSTIFFSNVTIRRKDLAILKLAGRLVRKLHLHNPSMNAGFSIGAARSAIYMENVDM
ncbi:hypothetical protein BKA64DRAFT_21618 [Cadophora sp. MPI-SDFR-AT-0126]|nr:hypothetical protein BKA64DRAFT_21618 [Leotiomycetes sp. MPI-SDFR-AT-0126]